MNRIIPPETYKFIEAKLHGYEEIKRKIEEWELSVRYPENRQVVPGVGYISDPTANIAVRLAEPPKHIRELIWWRQLIEQTQEYCRQHRNRIFDIWYGKGRQSCTRAYTRNCVSKLTFKKNRDNAVHFCLFRAINAGLCRLNNNKQEDENAAF